MHRQSIRQLLNIACFSAAVVSSFVVGLTATADEGISPKSLAVGTLSVNKVLFLGNSITLHGPLESIGWTGNWGMAASDAGKDYVHLLSARLANAAKGKPNIMVRNVADFERQHATFDVQSKFTEEHEFNADLIIIAIGENVPTLAGEKERADYEAAVTRLLESFQTDRKPAIFVRSTFWSDDAKNEAMRQACMNAGATFVDLGKLDADETNFARSERRIDHAGVAGHPGDKGMKAISDGLWNAIEKASALTTEK